MKTFRGVSLQRDKWRAVIHTENGECIYLGLFPTHQEAVLARLEAEKVYGVNGVVGTVKEVYFATLPIRTVTDESGEVWIVLRDILAALQYNPDGTTAALRKVPAEFTGTINVNSHTKSYKGVNLVGALCVLSNVRTPIAADMKKWLLCVLYPRTALTFAERVAVITSLSRSLEDSLRKM